MNEDARRVWQAAYESSHRSMADALTGTATADGILDTYAEALRRLDGSLEGTLAWTQNTIACRAGCSFCCWLQIDVRAHEVFLIVRHLRQTRTPEALAILRAAAVATLDQTRPMNHEERGRVTLQCVLLQDGLCSVYAVRPAACRRYHSRAVAACEQLWQGADEPGEIEFPFVAEMGRHLANGMHNAFVRAGFDGFCYDLTSALAEALTYPECERRWLEKEKAFSADAESKVPPGFSQVEAVARLKASLGE